MARSQPASLPDRLAGACCTLLLAAGALYVAVRLVEAIWPALLVISGVVGGLGMR